MGSRNMLSLSLLVVLALLCLQPCKGDDGNATALGDDKTDDGGIFGFSFSPLSFFFSSDDDNKEKAAVPNDDTGEKTVVEDEDEADNTDNHIDKDREEEKTSTEELDDKNDDAVDKGGSDADTAHADTTTADVSDADRAEEEEDTDEVENADTTTADVSNADRAEEEEDTDEVETEIDRLKDDAKLDEFLDEGDQDEDIQPKRSRHQQSSANKDLAGSEPTASSSAHNTSLALRDPAVCQQSPNIADLSQYLRTCQNCLVRWDRYQCPLHDQVLELKKWMTELQDLLSYGCRMDESCVSTEKCCHNRDPALGRAVEEMTQVAKEMYDLFLESCSSCPRDGGWSEWCEWGSCSVTCGEGTRTRRRQCDSPTPKANGRPCQGLGMDSTPCSGPACCTDGNWSPWSQYGSCQGTCGQGLQERTRTCGNPPANHCGRTCPGPSADVRPCETGRDCCVNGNWAEWSSWSSCPVTCGRGTVDRYRTCNNPAPNYCGQTCPGLAREARSCEVGDCCVNGNWADWSSWSPCPVTCGRGTVDRYRTCNNPAPNYCGQTCPGTSRDMRSCEVDDCCVDGEWGSWLSWSTCSATCGSGTQSRMRRCDSPSPNFCGRRCPGLASDTRACVSERECCVDGNWGQWDVWSSCSASCGLAVRERERRCNSPAPNYCGQSCPGFDIQEETCSRLPVCEPTPSPCVNGNWADWSSWSPCPVTCGRGTVDRYRTCSNPAPNYCGQTCPGLSRDARVCELDSCCVDGQWSEWWRWSSCSATCEKGTRERTRSCDSPTPNFCGRTCSGPKVERDTCETGIPCPPPCVDGNWGLWGTWSACPVTCGQAQRERRRVCDSPAPNICGQTCPGLSFERIQQRCGPDEVAGNWEGWQAWGACSVTCGRGQQLRRRICDVSVLNECVRPCPGSDLERRECDRESCCVNGNWGQWERWGACSVSCGQGSRERRRQCDNPAPNFCGQSCSGPGVDRDTCDTRVACQPVCENGNWGSWGSWGACPVTCGQSHRERRRLCDSPPPNVCGQTCSGPSFERASYSCGPLEVDGNWGSWSTWSSCPVTCGQGQRERRRLCDSPSPNVCGRTCPGPSLERTVQPCGPEQVTGNWEGWQAWGACSVTCGRGQQLRRRICDVSVLNECVRPCPGSDLERRECDRESCCVNGNWGQWERWGACSVSCGQGSRERRRQCDNPAPNFCGQSCSGPGVDRDTCDTRVACQPVCENGNWGSWGSWGACPVTCGQSHRERRRLCDSPPPNVCGQTCSGPSFERASYSCGPLEVDGNWGSWSTWSSCPVTCGQGQRERRRLCDSPSPNVCGRTCPGPSLERTVQPCGPEQVDGQWGMWGSWSACPVTCGVGQVERRRFCDAPAPNVCGRSCPGAAFERDQKRCGPEPIDGNWGSWEQWGACSATCGFGRQNRRRRCDSPNECGRQCRGSDVDIQDCNLPRCCAERQWSTWSQWSICSSTCGTGTRTRQRTCQSVGFGEDCGTTCPGLSIESSGCPGLPTCEAPWGPWSPCSATCEGQGTRERRRQYGGVPGVLEGSSVETEPCRVFSPPCPRWSNWESWCPCDCRKGISSRRRSCLDPSGSGKVDIQHCGSGLSREERKCDVREVCPVCVLNCTNRLDGNYTSCTSCRDYVQCRSGEISLISCTAVRGDRHEWDAFIGKCRPGDSPSCTLQPCVSSCVDRDDGPAPSCFGCSNYLQCRGGRDTELTCPLNEEFNAHSGQCERKMSPTCIRPITRRLDFMMGDAPAERYFDMDEEDAEERYEELLKETGMIATLGRNNQDARTLFKTPKTGDKDDELDNRIATVDDGDKQKTSPRMSKKNKKEVQCQADCAGVAAGLYQSCLGCDHYVVCTKHGIMRLSRCPRSKVWDDKHKKCRKISLTCKSPAGSKQDPGMS